jgi:hypothetical protein
MEPGGDRRRSARGAARLPEEVGDPNGGAAREAGYRQRRRAEQRAKKRVRLVRNGAILGVLLLAAVVFLVVRAIGGEGGGAEGRQEPAAGGGDLFGSLLLVLDEDERMTGAALLWPDGQAVRILGIPVNTLLQGERGFEPLQALHERDPEEALDSLAQLLGIRPGGYARTGWADLRSRAEEAAPEPLELPESLVEDRLSGAEPAGRGLVALAGADEKARRAIGSLPASEGQGELRASLEDLRGSVEEHHTLPGRLVEGAGFVYYEPDVTAIRALLGTASGGPTEVEVQNGSGAVGVAEAVVERIQPLGYSLLPSRNADQFPDVETTQIFAAPDALDEGERVREVVTKGRLVPLEQLPPGRIVVVVGKDLSLEDLQEGGGR